MVILRDDIFDSHTGELIKINDFKSGDISEIRGINNNKENSITHTEKEDNKLLNSHLVEESLGNNNNISIDKIISKKKSPLIFTANKILNTKNFLDNTELDSNSNIQKNEKEAKNLSNNNLVNSFNKSNYSQDSKAMFNEYWQNRRAGLEPSKFLNEPIKDLINDISRRPLEKEREKVIVKESSFRSSILEVKNIENEKKIFEDIKNSNDKNMENYRHVKKIEFKKDVVVNRKRMDKIEGCIKDMVVEATYKARDELENFMYKSGNSNFLKKKKEEDENKEEEKENENNENEKENDNNDKEMEINEMKNE